MFSGIINGIIIVLAAKAYCSDYNNDYGPDYGKLWFLFIDENGTTHKVNFSSLPAQTRGIFLGRVYCHLYTRQNRDDGELLRPPRGNANINSTYFNSSNAIKAITHGWLSSATSDWIQNIKDTLLKTADLNVITVDWSEIAKNPLYPWPAFSTRYVGKYLNKVLNSLTKTYNVTGDTHLIGHSLGAHVMGYAGMFSQGRVQRITGLDPARPLFEVPPMSADWKLEKSDAQFVDIIHTCGGIYGYKRSYGHADFYPNTGSSPQPGCEGFQEKIEACSHGKAHEYFLQSIADIGYIAYPCESWNAFERGHCTRNGTLMGYPADDSNVGNYYLVTNNETTTSKQIK